MNETYTDYAIAISVADQRLKKVATRAKAALSAKNDATAVNDRAAMKTA